MYSACLFCHGALGRNQVVEAFPVGRRLAFDGAKGRLWAVCPNCRRWNLTPLEERWEAIEACEKIFRTLPVRSQTGEIGAARHPEGLGLIRIGKPVQVELATWRFGEAMGQRLKRQVILTGIFAAAGGVSFAVGALSGGAAGLAMWYGVQGINAARNLGILRKGVTIPLPTGEVVKANPWKIDLMNPEEGQRLGLRIRKQGGEIFLFERDAVRAASKVLPWFNRLGARRNTVKDAVSMVEGVGGPEGFLQETWGKARPRPGSGIRWVMSTDMKGGAFSHLPLHTRVGLEMSIHQEQERVALAGEMAELRAAWREAEAIASISDELLIPKNIRDRLEELKRGEE